LQDAHFAMLLVHAEPVAGEPLLHVQVAAAREQICASRPFLLVYTKAPFHCPFPLPPELIDV
tara:strand:- start:408 stop:593 length:186 start_codon:yes stop_codon:yes gene_type:complete